MKCANSNNNNSKLTENNFPSVSSYETKNSLNNSKNYITSITKSNTGEVNNFTYKNARCMSSSDLVTPQAWKGRGVKGSENNVPVQSVSKPQPKNSSVKAWKPAPRLLLKQKADELKSNGIEQPNHFQNKQNGIKAVVPNDAASEAFSTTHLQSRSFQSKKIVRDPKSPSFGTLKRMWDEKSASCQYDGSQNMKANIGQKVMGNVPQTDSWHPVRTSQKNRANTALEDIQDHSSIDCFSPKPFKSVTLNNKSDKLSAFDYFVESTDANNKLHDKKQNQENNNTIIKSVDENKASNIVNQSEDTLHSMEVNFLNDNKVIHNSEIPIYVDVDLKEDNKTDSRLYLKDSDDEPPPVPPHEPIIQSFLQTVPSSRDLPEDKPNYLCMDGSSSIENSSYVDMTSDTEVLETDYIDPVVVPPPLQHYSKSHREYVDIDPKVIPSPPNREPPGLPLAKDEPPSCGFSTEEPPPLPPENSVGRRSVSHAKENKLQIIQNLDKKDSKNTKVLKYVEVEVGTYQPSSKAMPKPMSTKYTQVTVPHSGSELLQQDRKASGTNEEGIVETKKSMNVKQMIQSFFSKDESKSSQTKSSQENLTDFEKERNKLKRLSGRFLRRKTKEANKVKKGGGPIPSSPRSTDAVSSEGIVVSPLTSVIATSQRPVSNNSSVSPNSSGDGEVGEMDDYIVPSIVPSSSRETKVKPMSSIDSRSVDEAATFKATSFPRRQSDQNYDIFSPNESTFLAYPSNQSQSHNDQSPQKLQKSSFLYGSNSSSRSPPKSGPSVISSVPPRVPPHSKQLSASVDDSSTLRSAPIPLPGLAPERRQRSSDPATSIPMYLPPILTSSRHSDPGTDGFKYLNVRESGPSLSEGFYTAAQEVPLKEDDDSVPPPIPERDDSDDQIYECIEASRIVPPTPVTKEEPGYNFLLSEPLYQVYRRRTMSHASSKRREERRDKAQSEPEKSLPEWESELMFEDLGTSTLWRSIPQVESRGLPAQMSPDEIKLQQAQFEVITSEASYLRSLDILVNHFMNDQAMLSSDILPASDRRHLFSNIETVRSVENKLLRDLEEHFWNDLKLTRVADSIAYYAKSDFKVYILYIQNQVYQDRVLTKLQRTHDRFAYELSRLESSPACNKLTLLSFLLLPMQRVTRLPLLISAIVNAADVVGDSDIYKKAKHALGIVNKLVKTCNESARKMQQTEQLAEIASQLEYSSSVRMFALISQSRSLIKKGEMNVCIWSDSKKGSKTKLWLFLFTDVLLIAKKKGVMEFNASLRYEVIDWAGRQYLAVNEHAAAESAIYLVILENQAGKRVEMSLMSLSQNELSRWETALNPPSVGPAGESIYEQWDCPQYECTYPYQSQQPDELALEVGDVMQVFKKTSDGWLEGERMRDGDTGWFPATYCKEIEDEHVRSRNMKLRYREDAAMGST